MLQLTSWLALLLCAMLWAGCSPSEEDLRRDAAEGDLTSLATFINERYPRGEESELVQLALDLLAESPSSEGRAMVEAFVLNESGDRQALHAIERANELGWAFTQPQRLFEVYADQLASSDSQVSLANLDRQEVAVVLAEALRHSARPEDWARVLGSARELMGQGNRETFMQIDGIQRSPKIYSAYKLLRAYYAAQGPHRERIADAIEALSVYFTEGGQLVDSRVALSHARSNLASAQRRYEELSEEARTAYSVRRFFIISDLGRTGGVATYEVALPDPFSPGLPSRERALLLTTGGFTSRGWATIVVRPLPSFPMRLREELGGFEQVWPAFAEVQREWLDEEIAALQEAEANQTAANDRLDLAERENERLEKRTAEHTELALARVEEVIEHLEKGVED